MDTVPVFSYNFFLFFFSPQKVKRVSNIIHCFVPAVRGSAVQVHTNVTAEDAGDTGLAGEQTLFPLLLSSAKQLFVNGLHLTFT